MIAWSPHAGVPLHRTRRRGAPQGKARAAEQAPTGTCKDRLCRRQRGIDSGGPPPGTSSLGICELQGRIFGFWLYPRRTFDRRLRDARTGVSDRVIEIKSRLPHQRKPALSCGAPEGLEPLTFRSVGRQTDCWMSPPAVRRVSRQQSYVCRFAPAAASCRKIVLSS
jgi:hypothetical protein